MPILAVSPHGEAIGGAAVRQVARCSHRIEHRLAFALADEVGMDAVGAETGIIGSDDDVATAQHFAQAPDHAGDVRHERRRARGPTPKVGCAQAITLRPSAGAGPGGMKIAPETGIGWPLSPVER